MAREPRTHAPASHRERATKLNANQARAQARTAERLGRHASSAPAEAGGSGRGSFECLFAPDRAGLAVCSIVRKGDRQAGVAVDLDEARTTANEPPVPELGHVAEGATDIPALRFVAPNEARAATDKPPVSGREDVTNEPSDSDWEHVNPARIRLHYEPPRIGADQVTEAISGMRRTSARASSRTIRIARVSAELAG
jgi:hypothetical protein